MVTTDLDFVTSQRVIIAQSAIAFSGEYDSVAGLIHVVLRLLYLFSYLPWFEFFYWALERLSEFKKDLSEVCVSCVCLFVCVCVCVCVRPYAYMCACVYTCV